MSPSRQSVRNLVTGGGILLFLFIVWFLRGPLVPLLLGAAGAFILEPLSSAFEKRGRSRLWALVVAAVALAGLGALVVFVLVPSVVGEWQDVSARLPGYREVYDRHLAPKIATILREHPEAVRGLPERGEQFLREHAAELAGSVFSGLEKGLGSILGAILGALNLLVAPAFLFYLVADGRAMIQSGLELIPLQDRAVVSSVLGEIEGALRRFLRGQLIVCACLATIYGAGLGALGVPLALAIAIVAGLANLVPYLGLALGLSSALLMAFLEYQVSWRLIGVAVVFAVAQMVEGLIITPRVVGKSVGLHPVVVLVSILVWGEIFGFAGILLALPITAVLMVLFRRAAGVWRGSEMFQSGEPPARGNSVKS